MAITAAEINAILAEWQTRNTRTYIGMRYVPVFKGVWDGSLEYEPLTIVQSDGSAYVSKSYVPVGVPVTDATFWMPWGDFADGVVTLETLSAEVASAYVRTFDTVADMQAATDLLAGMTCHTNGFHTIDDGGAAYYTVASSGDVALQGGLYASKVAYKAQVPSSPKILAHRGISTISSWVYSIDNSLWSLMGAMANGFDGFECDVRKDVNGVLVMIHDADVSSVSNSSGDIDTLDYSTVKYATRRTGVTTDTTLTTLAEAAQVAKAFNAFMFVNVKDTTISAQQVTNALLAQGLDYDNFGVFIDEDNSSWVASALSVPHANIGYSTTNYTATAAEMAQLKTMADTAGKPYDEIIVRCVNTQDLVNIKSVGFKSSLERITQENNIDCTLVDYAIDSRRWNGEDDATTNYKGRGIRTFASQAAGYSTLGAFLSDAISDNLNHFFGRISASTLTTWMTAANITSIQGLNNGGQICGTIDGEFATGFIHVLRARMFIMFSYERATDKLFVSPISTGFYNGLTQAYLDSMLTDAKSSSTNTTHFSSYLSSTNAQSILGAANTYGCNVDITNSNVMQTMIAIPVNTSLKTIYVYKRGNTTDTPTIYTITGA